MSKRSRSTELRKAHALRWICAGLLLCMIAAAAVAWKSREGLRFAQRLGAGINLGNSLDVYRLRERKPEATIEEYVTYWGNPPITSELMREIRQAGFSTVRIPVSWGEHMDSRGQVDAEWMAYVTETVDAGLDADLYVILDIHHEPWLVPTAKAEPQVTRTLETLWRQIAENFADRGDHLLFEAMNEPRLEDSDIEWTSGSTETRETVNRLNAAFVRTVRASGGYNAQRWLLLPAYGSSYRETALAALELPRDSHLLVAVHAYLPYSFALDKAGTDQWDSGRHEDTKDIDRLMERAERLFLKRKIPVVITEYGCDDKGDRLSWAEYYTRAAQEKGIPLIWWDEGKSKCLIDRESCDWVQPDLAALLIRNAVRPWPD